MTTLHIINKSPSHIDIVERCLRFLAPGDAILLIEESVYYALPAKCSAIKSHCITNNIKAYALEEDLKARGVFSQMDDTFTAVSYDGFVELSTNHQKSISWY